LRKEEKMKNRLMVFVFMSALLISFGIYAAEMKKSGFLSDYSGMKPGPKESISQGIRRSWWIRSRSF
jgi:hypothetical protein